MDITQRQRLYDDSEWTEEEMMQLAAEAAEDLDNMDEIQP